MTDDERDEIVRKALENTKGFEELGKALGRHLATVLCPGKCCFIHDNIDTLYGVPVMPIKELPQVCSCGEPLTYADEVCFVNFNGNNIEDYFDNTEVIKIKKEI